jgi:hypothetical protein
MFFTLILLGYSIINIILEVQAGEGGSYVTLLKLVLGITLIWLGVSEEKYWNAGTGKGESEVTLSNLVLVTLIWSGMLQKKICWRHI